MTIPMGPKRKQWEKLKRSNDRLALKIRQYNTDLASIKENNPHCRDLAIDPIDPGVLGDLPPMPEWSE